MGLRARHRRMLEATEHALRASDPHLFALFAFFDRLNRDEEMPRIEEVRHRLAAVAVLLRRGLAAVAGWLRPRTGPRIRAALFFPLALALLAASFAISPRAVGADGCARRPATTEPARIHDLATACGPDTVPPPLVGK